MSSRASFTINAGLTTLGLQARVRSIEDPSDPDVTIASIGAFGRARINDDIELATSVFLHFPEGSGEAEPAVTHDTSVTFFPEDGLRLGLRLERRYVDETSRSVQDGIFANDVGAEAEFLPDPETRLGARATVSVLSDDNGRVWGSLEASRRILAGDHQAWLGLRGPPSATGARRRPIGAPSATAPPSSTARPSDRSVTAGATVCPAGSDMPRAHPATTAAPWVSGERSLATYCEAVAPRSSPPIRRRSLVRRKPGDSRGRRRDMA
jgi:hypothetical protein